MEQIRAPQAAPEWPSAELGIDEKRSLRKGVKSAFNDEAACRDSAMLAWSQLSFMLTQAVWPPQPCSAHLANPS